VELHTVPGAVLFSRATDLDRGEPAAQAELNLMTASVQKVGDELELGFTADWRDVPLVVQGNPGSTYRCKDGKVERKDSDGTWKKGREKKIKDKPIRQQTLWLGVNQRAPRSGILWSMDWSQSLPIQEGDVAPFDGWLVSSPGDEVVTLPAF
jgi:hypothetical protein